MSNDKVPSKTKVLVIGGGPAGSLSASFLAQEGIDVVVCEKDKFPRYHIGESLLPSILPILEFLGVREEIDKHGFIKKYGASWKVKKNLADAHLDFTKQPIYKYSYQVIRSEFDQILLNYVEKLGGKVFQETMITDVHFDGDRPTSASWKKPDGSEGNISFEYLIDASGLAGLLSRRYLKNRKFQPAFANIALAGYWKNFKHYVDEEGKEYPGEFLMHVIPDGSGWIWGIPLHDGTLSVGVVIADETFKSLQSKNLTMEQIYQSKVDQAWGIKDMISEGSRVGEIKFWNDYSYYAERFAGENFRLVGDAAAFLDPLLSSGVHIASIGALAAAASLLAAIKGDCSPKEAADFHDAYIRASYTRFSLLLTAIYQQVTNQEEVVLHGISGESVQSVFDVIQPMLTGNYDLEKDQPVGDEMTSNVISYLKGSLAESHFSGKKTEGGGKSFAAIFSESDLVTDSSVPIKGFLIRFEKGNLGLRKAEKG